MPDQYDREIQVIDSVADAPPLKKFCAYAKISGPGWLQGAITLGGGSLAGALFLGVISGYNLLWVQPLAMICGVIMLSAIAYVTLSTGQRPFHAINRHLNPLLGWSWLIATIMANMVWAMPQFALATASIQQNLLGGATFTPAFVTIPLFVLGLFVNYLYQAEGKGAKAFDAIIKIMVAIIVLSFFVVVGVLLFSGKLPLGHILGGFIPNPAFLFKPAAEYEPLIAQSAFPDFWRAKIASDQRDVIITAFGTAVGINMTFLLPYTLLKKRWGKKHRGLSITDLSIGLFIPFFLATTCVVIAAASSFHGKPDGYETGTGAKTLVSLLTPEEQQSYQDLGKRLKAEGASSDDISRQQQKMAAALTGRLGIAEKKLAASLEKRDTDALAKTLEPFAGELVSQKIFGVGVLGMAVSTIIILMLMNGVAFQEAFGCFGTNGGPSEKPKRNLLSPKALFYLGATLSGVSGVCFPLLWTGDSKAALAVPTSVIGGSLLPIAYFTFFLMMNSKKILGEHRPEGRARLIWNLLMGFSTSVATLGSIWAMKDKSIGDFPLYQLGYAFLALLFVVGTVSFFRNEKRPA